jgi:hypothetical protein
VSIALANHNDDIRRLLEKGYALADAGGYLIVRDIPHLDARGDLQWAAFVAKLVPVDKLRVRQHNHQVSFTGGTPYGTDGKPIPNLGEQVGSFSVGRDDVVVQRTFSNKPTDGGRNGFADFFEKIEHYTTVIAGPAIARHKVSPYTFRLDEVGAPPSVFKYRDSLTSRAEIGDLAARLKDDVVAVIGLGGTGGYVLDFLVKSPVKAIRAYDGDDYYVHNAFRSPGELLDIDLGRPKAEVYQRRYESFREGLTTKVTYIDETSAAELAGVTFAFVCVDKGTARERIFDLLIGLGIPFIDVGLGLDRNQGALNGTVRATYYPPEAAAQLRAKGLAEEVDKPDDAYRQNVQIAELNAINACFAVIRYKQARGVYVDDGSPHNLLMDLGKLKTFGSGLT